MEYLAPKLRDGRYLARELMVCATEEPADKADKDNATLSVFKAVEWSAKGIEVPLPDGHQFLDKNGQLRSRVPLRWWDEDATTEIAAWGNAPTAPPGLQRELNALVVFRQAIETWLVNE